MRKHHLPWSQPNWRADVETWIATTLAQHGLSISGASDQPHIRPWATVLRVPTQAGDVYLKAVAPDLIHEIRLTRLLNALSPEHTLPLLGSDAEHGWMLMPDGGARLREVVRAGKDLRNWEAALESYAAMQLSLAAHVPALLSTGMPDRRLAALPGAFAMLLEDMSLLRADETDGLSSDECARLRAAEPRIAALCGELAAFGIPESLHHGDLHDGNIFLTDGRARFFDWGDSSIAHPFFSMRTALVSLEILLDWPDDTPASGPDFDRLRNAYLRPWQKIAPHAVLSNALEASTPLAPLCSALSWQRAIAHAPPAARAEYLRPVPALLRECLGLLSAP